MHFSPSNSRPLLKHAHTILTYVAAPLIIASIPSLSVISLFQNLFVILTLHIHLVILISACWSANLLSFFTGHVSLPCNLKLCTQLLYNFPLVKSETSLLVSRWISCLNLFHPLTQLRYHLHSACHPGWLIELKFYIPVVRVSALTQLIGWQEGHPARKNPVPLKVLLWNKWEKKNQEETS